MSKKLARKFLKIIVVICGTFFVLFLYMTWLVWSWIATPPLLPDNTSITLIEPVEKEGKLYLGKNWIGERDGLRILYLTGTPFELGYANGFLTRELMYRQEDALIEMFHRYAPTRIHRFLIKIFITYQNRNLPNLIKTSIKEEILGLSAGCPDIHPDIGPFFHRLLNYHAAHDVSYLMADSSLITACTGFGTLGEFSSNGHMLKGRNFDWEADPVFDKDRLLIMVEPDDGIPFVSLAWGGMVGSVSGMNREGIAVSIYGAPSHLPKYAGVPMCLLIRDILQNARSLDEAIYIVKNTQTFVSGMFLIGSAKDNAFVVIEKTPECTVVRSMTDSVIICSNHFMTNKLAEMQINQKFIRESSSVPRYNRMVELLESYRGNLTPEYIATILRDRCLEGNIFAGNGHRRSINSLIATHSVIFDLTSLTFWAATPPHQMGAFVPICVKDFNSIIPGNLIEPDPILASGEYDRYLLADKHLQQGWTFLQTHQYYEAIEQATKAEELNPGFYKNKVLLGNALLGAEYYQEAKSALTEAIQRYPEKETEKQHLIQLVQHLLENP